MSGPGADYTPFSRTCNVVLSFDTAEDLEPHQREACYRIAGLKAAHYLASACKDAAADSVEAYDFPPLAEAMHQHPGLPKVAYMYMLQSQGLLHDTWVYGVDAKRILPYRTDGRRDHLRQLRLGLRQEQYVCPSEQPRGQKPL